MVAVSSTSEAAIAAAISLDWSACCVHTESGEERGGRRAEVGVSGMR